MRCLTLLLSGLILTLLSAHPAQAATRPVLYGGTVLFVDNHRVQSTSGVTKVYYRGQKMRVANRPVGQVDLDPVPGVDSRLLDMTTIIKEGDLWRMWLRSGLNVGYRESTDGLHWHIKDPDHVILVRASRVLRW